MHSNNCSSCKFGRIDSAGHIFCAKYNINFDRKHFCDKWEVKQVDDAINDTSKSGYIYILSNKDLPGLLKVGMTKKTPEIRASELSGNTGVSSKYVIEYYGKVNDRINAEKSAHSRLNEFHYNKEFFRVGIDVAIYCVETISCRIERKYIKPGNEEKVIEYALNKGKVPPEQIYHEWKIRKCRKIKSNNDYKITRNWELEVEEYFEKQKGSQDTLFNYNSIPGNPSKELLTNPNYIPKKTKNEMSNLETELKNKENEINKLKKELDEERNKGFFKKLFSKK